MQVQWKWKGGVMTTYEEFLNKYSQHTGTLRHHAIEYNLDCTDGVLDVCNSENCFWFTNIISSYQGSLKNEGFQVWTLTLNKNELGIVICDNGDDVELIKQVLPYVDIECEKVVFWCIDGVILLPSEY